MAHQSPTYKHYKGGLYSIICEARHSETSEEFVVYRDVREPEKVWIRPKRMFFDAIELESSVIPRFRLLVDDER